MAFLDNYSDNTTYYDKGMKMRISPDNLLRLISYTAVKNPFVRQKNLKNLEELLNSISINKSFAETDVMAINYFKFLKELVRIINLETMSSYQVLEDYFYDELADKEITSNAIEECFNQIEATLNGDFYLSEKETLSINKMVEDKIRFNFILEKSDIIKNMVDDFTIGTLDTGSQVENAERVISDLYQNMTKVKTMSNLEDQSIDFTDKEISKHIVKRHIGILRSPENRLKSGFKALNKMVNGGFQSGRLYVFAGTPKSFKSGTLLNIVLTALDYNTIPYERTHGRKPVILYYTMENDSIETLDRIFYYYFGCSISESKLTPEEVTEKIYEMTSKNGIGLIVKYAPSQSVNTEDLVNLLNELKDEGRECIMLVQDYLRRIRPAKRSNEQRLDMGNIADEFSIIAKTFGIPVITATQLNREATNIQEKAKLNRQYDVAQNLFASHIAESVQIQQNTDYMIVIVREDVNKLDHEGNQITSPYLTFKLVASRDRQKEDEFGNKLEYFALPFDNGFRLTRDEGTESKKYYPTVVAAAFTDKEQEEIKNRYEEFSKQTNDRMERIWNTNTTSDIHKMVTGRSTSSMNDMKILKDISKLNDPSNDLDDII